MKNIETLFGGDAKPKFETARTWGCLRGGSPTAGQPFFCPIYLMNRLIFWELLLALVSLHQENSVLSDLTLMIYAD